MRIYKQGIPSEVVYMVYTKMILRRNWENIGDTKIYSNYMTSYLDVLDKRFYSLSYIKRKV
jgi:hypothetical protein